MEQVFHKVGPYVRDRNPPREGSGAGMYGPDANCKAAADKSSVNQQTSRRFDFNNCVNSSADTGRLNKYPCM